MMCIQEHNMFCWRVKCSRSAGGLNKKSCYWAKKTNKKPPKTIKLKQMTPFQKAGQGSVSLMEFSFLWTIWQRVAPLSPPRSALMATLTVT